MTTDWSTFTREDREKRAEEYLRNLPNLHERPTRSHSGGLDLGLGRAFIEEFRALESPSVIETGAGNSTVLFLMLGAGSAVAIATDPKLGDNIAAEITTQGLDATSLRFICDRSERVLPQLALEGQTSCDVAFIDGNHGWPSVFVDFCYLNMMMKSGALLFIDDIHVYSVAQLVLLLDGQDDYERVRVVRKMATYRKVKDAQFLPDFRQEPFIVANTIGGAGG